MGFLKLVIVCSLWFNAAASLSGADHCHFKNDTAAFCDTFYSVITPDLSENTRYLNIHYSGPEAVLSNQQLRRYKQLENITISGNVRSVRPLAFKFQKRLKSLAIVGTAVSKIPNDLFGTNMTSLHELHLQQNKLENIPFGLFRFLKELRVLNLADNCIRLQRCAVGEEFKHLSKLSSLNIAGLQTVRHCNLNSSILLLNVNSKLLHLNISGTIIDRVYSSNISTHFSALKELDMSSTYQLTNSCPTNSWVFFSDLPKTLNKIYLRRWRSILKPQSRCFLDEAKLRGLRNLPELESIDMRYSDSVFGPTLRRSTFANFTKLKSLDIGWCRIWDIEHLAFELCPQLKKVVLDGNPLGSKSMRLQLRWKKLESLSMRYIIASSDRLQTFLPTLSSQLPPNLQSIDVSGNFLYTFPFPRIIKSTGQAVKTSRDCPSKFNITAKLYKPNLQAVTIDHNYLTQFLPETAKNHAALCRNISNLTYLSMQHNRLERIDGLCLSIKRLLLKWNEIGKNWEGNSKALKRLHRLEYVDLSYNSIQRLPRNLLSKMNRLVEFHFVSNIITSLPRGIFDSNRNLKLTYHSIILLAYQKS